MTNEIAVQQHSEQRGPLTPERSPAVAQLMEFSDVLEIASRFAETLSRTSMAGVNYRGKPQEALGAILYGAELGLNPVQSLQQVFTVHGTPSIYARTMVALLKRHGYSVRTESSTDTAVTVIGIAPDGTTEASTWTIERAKQAGYVPVMDEKTGKYRTNANGKLDGNMKYLTDPQAMLYAKAAAEVSRKLAPDVLLGIAYVAEELESEGPRSAPVRVESQRVTAADLIGEPAAAAPTPTESGSNVGAEPASESTAEPGPQLASDEQVAALGAALKAYGKTTRRAQLDELSNAYKSKVTDPHELPAEWVVAYTEFLNSPPEDDQPAEPEQATLTAEADQ